MQATSVISNNVVCYLIRNRKPVNYYAHRRSSRNFYFEVRTRRRFQRQFSVLVFLCGFRSLFIVHVLRASPKHGKKFERRRQQRERELQSIMGSPQLCDRREQLRQRNSYLAASFAGSIFAHLWHVSK